MKDFTLKPIVSRARRRRKTPDKKTCGAYFAECDETGMIKIGRSKCVETRITTIRNSTGATRGDHRIWGVVVCAPDVLAKLESKLHEAFAIWRQQGEWFDLRGVNVLQATIEVARNVCGEQFYIRGLLSETTMDQGDIMPNAQPRWLARLRNGTDRKICHW